jgi:hypothetical protein
MIVAVAIKKDDVVYVGKKGERHNHVINDVSRPFGFLKLAEQGFVDDKGNFLNRIDACKHALECGQIKKQNYGYGLDSSDVW